MTSNPFRTLRVRMRFVVMAALVAAALLGGVASAHAATFDPEYVITNDNMRAYNSMSEKQIQAFLETQSGPLASLVTTDYAGTKRKASSIIWRACQEWKISPKVMLTMLQKEQSLLTRTSLEKNTLSRAIGAGCPNKTTNRYPGFGKQMWYGARLLDGYGEGKNGSTIPLYYKGIVRYDIYRTPKVKLEMQNLATYKLYVYNPSIGGNSNFWTIYRRYFGSTFASPRYQTVYRFRSKVSGTYIYTTSIAERVKLREGSYKKRWIYEGAKFKVDTAVPASETTPLYRFRNKNTGKYSFTVSKAKYDYRRSAKGRKTWTYSGVAFRIAKKSSPGATTVWKFQNKKTGAFFFTHSKAARDEFRTKASYKKRYRYKGVAFYLPRNQTP